MYGEKMLDEYNNLTLGSFVPNRLHVKINAVESAIGSDKYNGLEFHEIWHYFQTCMTAFGHKSWNIYRQGIGYILSEWIELINDLQINPQIPLGYFAQNSKKAAANSYLLMNVYRASAGIAAARSSVGSKHKFVKDLSIMLYPHEWLINPEVLIGENKYNLQGSDVLEGHAIFIEAVYSFHINNIPINVTLDKRAAPNKYFICLDYFIKALGPTRVPEFPVVCDLALQAYWNEPVTTEEQWRASHPGWRFVRIIEVLSQGDVDVKTADIKDNYVYYCDTVMRACGYPSLHDSLAAAATFYEGRHLLKTEVRMLEALKFRQENPSCGGVPFLNPAVWIEMKKLSKPSTIQRGDGLEVIVDTAERIALETNQVMDGFMLETIGEIHLQAFISQLLGLKQLDCENNQFCCGYKYFNIDNACLFHGNGSCTGILTSGTKAPVEISLNDEAGVISGCSFESMFYALGMTITDIDIDFTQSVLTLEDVHRIVSRKSV
jgi:hypothetical protein